MVEEWTAHELQRAVQHEQTNVRESFVLECGHERPEFDEFANHVSVLPTRLQAPPKLAEHEREMVERLALLQVPFALLHAEDTGTNDERNPETHVDLRQPAVHEGDCTRFGLFEGDALNPIDALTSPELLAHGAREAESGLEVVLAEFVGDSERVFGDADEDPDSR